MPDVADAGIAQAKESLNYTTILSPINGVVTRVNAKVGEMVVTGMMNNPGTKIQSFAVKPNAILRLAGEGKTPREITDSLKKDFPDQRTEIERDVREFLAVLNTHNLLK